MLDTLLSRATPPEVADDPEVQRTRPVRDAAERTFKTLKPRYERLRLLTNPGNRSLEELQATLGEQDEAFALFPTVAKDFHDAGARLKQAQQAFDIAHNRAYRARQAWHQARLQELEGKLVDLVHGPVQTLVTQIHDLIEQAAHEEIGVQLEQRPFANVPLYVGSSLQAGIELWMAS